MPQPVINDGNDIAHQALTIDTDFSVDIPISNRPTLVSVEGLLEGYRYSYQNGNVNISGTPSEIGGNKEWIISATNSDGTTTATAVYSVFGKTPDINLTGIGTQTIYYGGTYSLEIPISNNPSKVGIDGLLTGLKYEVSTNGVRITGVADDEAEFTVSQGVFTITASNVIGLNDQTGTDTETLNYTLAMGSRPVISSISTQSVIYNQQFSYTVTATAVPQHTFSASGLPSGISMNTTTGVISGRSTELGDYTVTVTATNPLGSDTETFTFRVLGSTPVLSSIGTRTATYNRFFSYTASATGIPTPSFSASGLPSGISINQDTGRISGTSTDTGDHSVTVTATNVVGSDSETFTLRVDRAPIISGIPSTYNIDQNDFFFDSFSVIGHPEASVSGSNFPPGISVSGSGTSWSVSGTTSSTTDRTATVSATNRAGSDSQSVFCNIIPEITVPNISVSLSSITSGSIQSVYISSLFTSSGSAATSYEYNNTSLGTGWRSASINTVVASKATTAPTFTWSISFRGRNSAGYGPTITRSFTLVYIPPPVTVPTAPRNVRFANGVNINSGITWDAPSSWGGEIGNYEWRFDGGSWGTPATVATTGSHTFQVRAYNSAGRGPAATFFYTVAPSVIRPQWSRSSYTLSTVNARNYNSSIASFCSNASSFSLVSASWSYDTGGDGIRSVSITSGGTLRITGFHLSPNRRAQVTIVIRATSSTGHTADATFTATW